MAMDSFRRLEMFVLVALHGVAGSQIILLSYAWWDLVVTDAVGKPLIAENLGFPVFSTLFLVATLILSTWTKRATPHAIIEAAIATVAMSLVSSSRLLSVLSISSESSGIASAIGAIGIVTSLMLVALLAIKGKLNSTELLRRSSPGNGSSLGDSFDDFIDGDGDTCSNNAELVDRQSLVNLHGVLDNCGDVDTDAEPPPYSQSASDSVSNPDQQPLLQGY